MKNHLAARIFNTPLLIHPQKLDAIIAGVGGRLLGTDSAPIIINANHQHIDADLPAEMFSTRRGSTGEENMAYQVIDGVAVINVRGALAHRTKMDADSTRIQGYNDLVAEVEAAMNNPNVHGILQVWDSPGGEVQGAFEAANRISALKGKKPMRAIADGMAASAAYLIASAADELAVSPTGYAGSIGVVARHVDFSQALAKDGITVTHIFAGNHKVDGNAYEPLSESVRADFQAEIDGIYEDFLAQVASHRGMSVKDVRKTQAKTYRAQAAVDAGLADRIATTDQMISELAALRLTASSGQTAHAHAEDKGETMSGNTPAGGQTAALTLAAATLADVKTTRPDLVASITQEAVAAELSRQAGVRANALAGHEQLIEQMAADGKTTPEQAAMAVLAAERESRKAAATAFAADAPTAVQSGAAPKDGPQGGSEDKAAVVEKAKALAKAEGIGFVDALQKLGVTHV